jgi:hypothetical protein
MTVWVLCLERPLNFLNQLSNRVLVIVILLPPAVEAEIPTLSCAWPDTALVEPDLILLQSIAADGAGLPGHVEGYIQPRRKNLWYQPKMVIPDR